MKSRVFDGAMNRVSFYLFLNTLVILVERAILEQPIALYALSINVHVGT